MKLEICVSPIDEEWVSITESTDGKQYLPKATTARNRFVYEDTVAIDVLKLNSSVKVEYTPFRFWYRPESEEAKIKLNKDGWFTAIHIVLPKHEWVERELAKKGSIIQTYDIVYFVKDNTFYKLEDKKPIEVTLEELLENKQCNTTMSIAMSDYVSISKIVKKNKELYKKIFENRLYNGKCKIDTCEANRLCSLIHLVKHYVRRGMLAEAERVIEKASHFMADNLEIIKKKKPVISGCGCGG